MLPRGRLALLLVTGMLASAALGCVSDPASSTIPGSGGSGGSTSGSGGGTSTGGMTGSGSASGSGGMTGTGSAPGTGGGTGGTVPVSTSPLLPARIRRVTNAEYDASVRSLLGTSMSMAASFPPDSRQGIFSRGGYTVNDAQRVDPVLAKQLSDAAVTLVTEARQNGRLANLSTCANSTTGGEACATTFIQSFVQKAYRRPLTTDEVSSFLTVYRAGVNGGAYVDGIDMIVRTALQSAGFLYLTEVGDGSAPTDGKVALTPYETSSALSYILTAAPPDDTLLNLAKSGGLADAAAREQQARRLLGLTSGQDVMVRFVREMFSLDQIAVTDKDNTVYKDFAGAKNSIAAESSNFVREVLTKSAGTIEELLGADWTIADGTLANLYKVSMGSGHTSLASTNRRGLMNQAAFLSIFAHASESGPVLRGVAIMRQVACMPLVSPTELNIDVTPPAFDATKTTRERFAIHSTDPKCAACHKSIDAFGFTFEGFDGMGSARPLMNGKPSENGLAVDTSGTVAGTDFDGTYADSGALAVAMSKSAQVRACLARQVFRSATGRSDNSVKGSEDAFVDFWKSVPAAQQGNILETMVAYVKNPTFVQRRPQ